MMGPSIIDPPEYVIYKLSTLNKYRMQYAYAVVPYTAPVFE